MQPLHASSAARTTMIRETLEGNALMAPSRR